MNCGKGVVWFCVASWMGVSLAAGQSLGDLARQQRAQKEKAPTNVKTYTNDNLPAPVFGEPVTYNPAPKIEDKEKDKKETTPAATQKPSDDKIKTRDYWRDRMQGLMNDLDNAREVQNVSESELNLLHLQQTRELDPNVQKDLEEKAKAKQAEVDQLRLNTTAARQAVVDFQKEFKASGANPDWIKDLVEKLTSVVEY
jgi:hypothetical protein